jgi:fermentation-respiration switch protein FrsA (DUF1100 family)
MPSIGFIKLLLLLPVLAYIGLMAYALIVANKAVFPAPPPGYSDSADTIKFPYDDQGNRVTMVFLPNPGSKYLFFYQHGNGEDLQAILPRIKALREAGYAVLAWDYPGYGTSDGKPSEGLIFEVARKIYRSIPESFEYSHENTILYGRSLGSGPATLLATEFKTAGLILDGAFTSTFRVPFKVRILPWDIFNNIGRLGKVRCPVLVVHGTADETVPYEHGIQLYEKAPEPKFFTWIQDGTHNNIYTEYADVYYSSLQRLTDFISNKPR